MIVALRDANSLLASVSPAHTPEPLSLEEQMRQPSYEAKRDHAFDVDKAVKKAEKLMPIPKGAKKYVELRKADLKKIRGY